MNEQLLTLAEEMEDEKQESNPGFRYYENKYELVSRIAFLCGVHDRFFEGENSRFLPEVAAELRKKECAMIVRHLCTLRNSIEHNFGRINTAMCVEKRPFYALSEYYPEESYKYLSQNGIRLPDARQPAEILCEINRLIADRINNCKDIIPGWMEWSYIREMFVMPNGQKREGARAAAELFYANKSFYPFGVYINWMPEDVGNLFANDYKFATTVYGWHGRKFFDKSNLSDAGEDVKNRIYDFINRNEKTAFVVDCENADPYSLCAVFNSLDAAQLEKITKVILYDDPTAAAGWKYFENHIPIAPEKVDRSVIRRVLDYKSLLDVKMSARVMKEFYTGAADSFAVVSSDSDFWGMMEELPQADFLVMLEHGKSSGELKRVLEEHEIFYCYTDDFYTGMDDSLKKQTMMAEFNALFAEKSLDLHRALHDVLAKTRIDMSSGEQQQYYDKFLKSLRLRIDGDGVACIEFKR